jgi:hypothetical protein
MILHSSAERIGIPNHRRLPQEENRLWAGLLSSLQYSLPCPLCKKHYSAFIISHPITSVTREFIRNWLFTLHSDVNARTGKQSTITIDKIPEIYSQPFNFSSHFHIVNEQMIRALRLGWASRNDTLRTIRFFEELKRYYDFF